MKVVPPGDQISWFQTQQHWSIVPLAMFLFMSQGFPLVHRTRSEERQAKGSYSVQFSNVSPKVYTRGQKFVTSLAPELESRFCRSFCLSWKKVSFPGVASVVAVACAIRHPACHPPSAEPPRPPQPASEGRTIG